MSQFLIFLVTEVFNFNVDACLRISLTMKFPDFFSLANGGTCNLIIFIISFHHNLIYNFLFQEANETKRPVLRLCM